ncbi:MAG: hypothetical protein U1F66_07385 [bacterium]
MSEFLKKKLSALFRLAMVAAVIGCAGINNATAPAPLAEIPASLSLPQDVKVDTPEVGAAVGGASLGLKFFQTIKNQVQDIGGEFFQAITFGFTTNELTNAAVSAILSELSRLQIPLNPVTRTFIANNAFLGTTVKIDFADFDFPGKPSACTGCTCPTGCDSACPTSAPPASLRPVCYRIWNDPFGTGDFVPLMAGYITQLRIPDDPATPENEENPGSGSFRVKFVQSDGVGQPPKIITNAGAIYDHRNLSRPLDKSSEYFLYIDEPTGPKPPDATVSHVKVEQVALGDVPDENSLLKTIRESINQPVAADPGLNSTFQYIARYRTDFDFWSGTFEDFLKYNPGSAFAVPPDIPNFTAACAQLSTAFGVDQGTCIDLGIDVTSVPKLDLVAPDDPRVVLPADFPPTPTF